MKQDFAPTVKARSGRKGPATKRKKAKAARIAAEQARIQRECWERRLGYAD